MNEGVERRGIERIRDILVCSLRGTNREGTLPPGVILDKLYYRVERWQIESGRGKWGRERERVCERERERYIIIKTKTSILAL